MICELSPPSTALVTRESCSSVPASASPGAWLLCALSAVACGCAPVPVAQKQKKTQK